MEQIMEKTMAKIYNTILFLLIASFIYAQTSPPSGYTTHYKLRMWSQGARPSADSLNQNWKDIDSVIYKVSQSVTIDTTQIAYKNKNNTFTGDNTFTGSLSSSNFTATGKVIKSYSYYESPDRNVLSLLNNAPAMIVYNALYDTITIHRLANWEDGLEFEIINMTGIPIELKHQSISGTGYQFYLVGSTRLIIPNFGVVRFRGIEVFEAKFFIVISKSF